MKKLFVIALLFIGFQLQAQDLTGTWEGEFIKGNIGLRQPAKMVLEIVEVEGRLYAIFDLYPFDTRKDDKPNISYTMEGKRKPEAVKLSLILGRVIDGWAAEGKTPDLTQFIFEIKSTDSAETLAGQWFRQMMPVNTVERGGGTFVVRRVSTEVSNRLKLPMKEKQILRKLEDQSEE